MSATSDARIRDNYAPAVLSGAILRFEQAAYQVAHRPFWYVMSRRNGIAMGTVEWSPQWEAWSFKPTCDSRFPLSAVAEIWKFIKTLGGRQV